MIHRALLGTLERFFGVLIEHYAGAFPLWLAPVQAVVIPVADAHHEYARRWPTSCGRPGCACELDERGEKMGYKIREAQVQKIPYMLVVGTSEADPAVQLVSVRHRTAGDLGSATPLDEWIRKIARLTAERATSEGDSRLTPGGVS